MLSQLNTTRVVQYFKNQKTLPEFPEEFLKFKGLALDGIAGANAVFYAFDAAG